MNFFNELPNGTCLLGEIYFPNNEGSSNVTTVMGCLTPKAIERQEKGDKLHYYIFDIWAWKGDSYMSKKCDERFDELSACARAYPFEYVEWAQYYEGRELWEQLQKILASGGEGIVMTKRDTIPSPGKRTARKTLKVKKELQENIDCFFTGRGTAPTRLYSGKELETWKYWENMRTGAKVEGELYKDYAAGALYEPVTKPYFHGWAGSLEIGVLKDGEIYPIGFLSGLTDEIKADPGAQKMRCIEVTAMEILPTGGIRHAKLEKFRPDLAPTDCTYEKYMK
jgi:ATP-dependent DNA ligase